MKCKDSSTMTELQSLNRKVKSLEETVKLLYAVVIEKNPYVPDMEEWDQAIEALRRGDSKPLGRYIEAGGIIPEEDDNSNRPATHRDRAATASRG